IHGTGMRPDSVVSSWMLGMVMAKPMEFTIVRAEPRSSGTAYPATKLDNGGESLTTASPHRHTRARNSGEANANTRGEVRHNTPETTIITDATEALPTRMAVKPPNTQPRLPMAITTNAASDTVSPAAFAMRVANASGTNAQKPYSSHMWPK